MRTAPMKTHSESSHHSLVNRENQSFFTAKTENETPFFSPVTIQPKLKIGSPDDQYEQQADRIADSVVQSSVPDIQQQPSEEEEEMLQMKCKECEEEELQMKSETGQSGGYASSEMSGQVKNPGNGTPLPGSVNREMSQKIGADFSDVNIHTGSKAAELNESIGARAFTHKKDIFFNSGEYNPASVEGKHLLAHELTHVVQQNRGKPSVIQRTVDPARVSCESYQPRENFPIFSIIGTNDPVTVIQETVDRSIALLDNTIDELELTRQRICNEGEPIGWPAIADQTANSLLRRFRLQPDNRNVWCGNGRGTVQRRITWFRNVRNILNSDIVNYVCLGTLCQANDWAYAFPGTRNIGLCRTFWNSTDVDQRAITLIHEAFHLYYDLPHDAPVDHIIYCHELFIGDLNNITLPEWVQNRCPEP